ncbi:hypothetical protein VTK73DRAFT_5250 [Phialemonium thermophilum]|uniref:Uncharacterized protein n=1 Tax=Phialemonium thermophilum TaxID=223376 RepID=A0ABR3V2J2_9PEZI
MYIDLPSSDQGPGLDGGQEGVATTSFLLSQDVLLRLLDVSSYSGAWRTREAVRRVGPRRVSPARGEGHGRARNRGGCSLRGTESRKAGPLEPPEGRGTGSVEAAEQGVGRRRPARGGKRVRDRRQHRGGKQRRPSLAVRLEGRCCCWTWDRRPAGACLVSCTGVVAHLLDPSRAEGQRRVRGRRGRTRPPAKKVSEQVSWFAAQVARDQSRQGSPFREGWATVGSAGPQAGLVGTVAGRQIQVSAGGAGREGGNGHALWAARDG